MVCNRLEEGRRVVSGRGVMEIEEGVWIEGG